MSRRLSMWIERALLAVGAACLGTYVFVTLDARRYQAETRAAFERGDAASTSETETTTANHAAPREGAGSADEPGNRAGESVETGTVLGMLDVPRLGLSTTVVQGDDEATLRKAAGHLPDTPLPWQPGNSQQAKQNRCLKVLVHGEDSRPE